ncbi:hypothetical protein F53441_7492 [Fusarium austroafricanum]|uniref:Uncharacterized protein n=1 Tax=Fusarium austroafricanum TaxID=2364996 RepID=A0A8H4NVF5_9HYPO|nr:hypothetical protein F53441_7492 [Fusarium austroafricanum]
MIVEHPTPAKMRKFISKILRCKSEPLLMENPHQTPKLPDPARQRYLEARQRLRHAITSIEEEVDEQISDSEMLQLKQQLRAKTKVIDKLKKSLRRSKRQWKNPPLTYKVKVLEAEIAKERDENKRLQTTVDELQQKISALGKRNKALAAGWVAQLQKHDNTILQHWRQLNMQQQIHEKEMEEAERLRWNSLTPRSVLVTHMLSQRIKAATPGPSVAFT